MLHPFMRELMEIDFKIEELTESRAQINSKQADVQICEKILALQVRKERLRKALDSVFSLTENEGLSKYKF